jgi:putative phosphoribosyl transferase
MLLPENVVELARLRDRVHVFADRAEAGDELAGMLAGRFPVAGGGEAGAHLFAIPAGGVPVAVPMARKLGLALDLAVVSKITLPWNTESGYGAVAFDGTVGLNQAIMPRLGLSEKQIEQGIASTLDKVKRRVRELRSEGPLPHLADRTAILVDDGLASGFTMRVAVEALRRAGAARVEVAVPTAHLEAARLVSGEVDTLYCANLRGGFSFAVADAYQYWYDVSEQEVADLLAGVG